MKWPTTTQLNAIGRHVITAAAGAGAMLGIVHLVSPEQAQGIVTGITHISQGVAEIMAPLGVIVAGLSGYFASRSASPKNQAASLAANPEIQQIIASPRIADAVPSDKVVSQ